MFKKTTSSLHVIIFYLPFVTNAFQPHFRITLDEPKIAIATSSRKQYKINMELANGLEIERGK